MKTRFSGKQQQQNGASGDVDGGVVVPQSDNPKELEEFIAKQGDVVRQLKAAGADKPAIDTEVKKLKALKEQLAKLTGQSVVADAAKSKKSKGKQKYRIRRLI